MKWPWTRKPIPAAPERPVLTPGGKPPMKVRPSGMARAKANPNSAPLLTFAQMFPRAPAPPGVPSDALMAMDDALSPSFGFAGQFGYYGEGVVWPGFPYLAELTQRPEYRMITEVRAKEMTRKGFELTYSGEDEADAESKLAELDKACAEFKVIDVLREAAEHDGFFGGAQVYIDLGNPNDAAELAKPLAISPAKIPKGGLKGFKNIEPMWSYPAQYNSSDPLAPHFFKPQQWYVNGKTVHSTRLMTMISREMPDILKPAYSFRGLSLSQMAKPYVDNWLRTRQSVSDLLHSFSIIVIMSNLQAQVQAGDDWATIYARVDEFNALRDNRGAFVLDKETEDAKNLAVPLGTLDALQAQSQEQMASVSQTPLVKLLGITPSGLNASSDGEIRVFYDTIHALQEHLYTSPLKTMLECIQLHLWGRVDPAIGHRWIELWQLDEAGAAAAKKTEADTDAVYIQEGVVGPDEVRRKLVSDKNSRYSGLDPDDLPEPPDDGFEEGIGGGEAKSEPAKEQRSGV